MKFPRWGCVIQTDGQRGWESKERHISSPCLVSTPRSLLLLLPLLLSCHAHPCPLLSPSVCLLLLLSSPIFNPAFTSLCSPHLCCGISCFPPHQSQLFFFCLCGFCSLSRGKPGTVATDSIFFLRKLFSKSNKTKIFHSSKGQGSKNCRNSSTVSL